MLISIPAFIGRFHPVLVHLPIGILMVALLLQLLSFRAKYPYAQSAMRVLLFTGMLSAILSCITGLLLSSSGEYEEEAVNIHKWMGIALAILSILLYVFISKNRFPIYQVTCALTLLAVLITGHLGGSITHGEGYLLAALSDSSATSKIRVPIPDVQKAMAYKDVIRPMLEEKCFGCHGSQKQKGKLRMDEFEALMKGGKNGPVITPGKPNESEMVKRIELPPDDEHHMAPKEKSQVTDNELMLLKWWIETGASSIKKVSELAQDEKIKPRLLSLQSGITEKAAEELAIPEEPVEAADTAIVKLLQQSGAVIIPVSRDKNYLDVNFIGDSAKLIAQWPLLLKLKSQIVSLKLASLGLSDSSMMLISKLDKLISLNISNNVITDSGISNLKSLANLRVLNLVGTNVSTTGLLKLSGLKNLKALYLYRTKVQPVDWKRLQSAFKNVRLDSGGYHVPVFESDTTEVKYKPQAQ